MKNRSINSIFVFALIALSKLSFGQIIYQHGFNSGITASSTYTVAPTTIDANLNSSVWSTAPTTFTSFGGVTGSALSLSNSGGTPTYSLTYNVVSGFNCDITAFSFWRVRSASGAQNYTLTVNGITSIGNGTVPLAGANTGTLAVSNSANSLSGTVNVVLQLGGASGSGTFRLDDFTLYGIVYPVASCTPPTIQSTLFSSSSITNTDATINWTSGNGGNVLVLMHQGVPVNSTPNSGTAYSANSVYGLGQQIGIGNYVVYDGTGNSVNVTGLTSGTDYYFSVYEYNTASGSPCYLFPALTGSLITTGIAPSCFEIESILADACDNTSPCPVTAQEGENEMVRFKVGSVDLNVNDLTINWASANPYLGIETNTAITSPILNSINATVTGCGYAKQAIGGTILPAGSTVLLVTSTDMCVFGNSFSNLSDTIYVIFQIAGNTGGHFLNYNSTSAIRTLSMTFSSPASCSDVVTYDANLLINQSGGYGGTSAQKDGGAIDFTSSGIATYVNLGCQAPVSPFGISIGANQSVCFNSSQTFSAAVVGSNTSVLWSLGAAATGTFSSLNTLATTYTPGLSDNGIIKLYCTAFKVCASQTLTVKDSVNVTILQLPLATVSTSNNDSLCPGATSVMSYSVTNSSFASVVTPGWSSPSGSGTTYTVSSPIGNSSVTYSLNLTNVCGTTLNTFTVYPLALPTVTLSATTLTACVGATLSLTAAGNENNFSWNNPVSTNSTVTITANTTTTGIVTSTNSCGSAFDTYTLTVTQNPTITVDNPNVTLCVGQSATITATSSSGTYTWQPGALNTNSIVVNTPSTYTVFTDNVCNSASVAVNVVVNATPVLTISATSSVLCAGGQSTATLSLVGSTGTYSWSTGVTTSTIAISTPGVYSATVNAGLCGIKDTSIVIGTLITPTISVALTSTLLCNGASATLTASSNLANFSWSNGATNTPTIVVTASDLYTVSVSNACGTPSASVNILADMTPTLNIVSTSSTICSGSTATLSVTGGIQPYIWSNSASTGSIVTTNGGTVSVSSSNACGTDTETISVSIIPNPTVILAANSYTACPGDIINIIANSSENNYSWSASAINTATLSLTATTSETGIVTTTNVCTNSSDSYTITVIAAPTLTVDLSNVSLCTGQTATITATSSEGNYLWQPGGITTNSIIVNSANVYSVTTSNACFTVGVTTNVISNSLPVISLTSNTTVICPNETATLTVTGGSAPYTWSNSLNTGSVVTTNGGTVTVSNTNLCGTATETINITVVNLVASIFANPTIGIKPVVVDFTNNSIGATTYLWDFGNGLTSSAQAVSSQTYNTTGTYTVFLTASNGSCIDTDLLIITVLNEEPFLIVPNVFTPNGDSINDVFRVTGFNIIDFNCTIFNRWGLQLFYWNDIKNGWDGKTEGENATDGTYFYMINAKDIDNKEIKKQGSFQLFK